MIRDGGRRASFGIGILTSCVVAAAATPATTPAHLNVKLGLWEMAMNPQLQGDLSGMIDPQRLQQMSPEDRARMQAGLQQMQAAMQKPRMTKECMTQEKLARGFSTGNDETNCKSTVVTNTSTDYQAHMECAAPDGNREVDVRFTAQSSDHVTGTVHSDMSKNGKTMKVDAKIEGHWLAADCGSITDSQEEKPVR